MPRNDSADRPAAIALIGPTATGKTELAVELVRRLPLDIVSVDSAMVYRGMDIGTAKPEAATLRVAPHRLIDICDPAEVYSAARFRHEALGEMEAITASGRIPLLVGGTMLYFRALEKGLAPLPGADAAIRARLEEQAREVGWPALHARLAERDPVTARRIHPNDPQRIERALEVIEITGRPMSDLLVRDAAEPMPFNLVKIQVMPGERGVLHQRIERRFQRMIERGLVREVEGLYARGDLHAGLPAIRAVGYRQLWQYLAGEAEFSSAVETAITESRRLARRQMTWMRAEPAAARFEAFSAEIGERILKYLEAATHYR